MTTLVLGSPPPELRALLERRRQAGVDRLDEVWQGVRHTVPAPSFEHARVATQLTLLLDGPARAGGLLLAMHEFNLGESEHDFRVPDGGLHRPGAAGVWLHTAAVVVEISHPAMRAGRSCRSTPPITSTRSCSSTPRSTPSFGYSCKTANTSPFSKAD